MGDKKVDISPKRMRYATVCSGIEATTVAWHSFGWEPIFLSEIEAFPNALLEHFGGKCGKYGKRAITLRIAKDFGFSTRANTANARANVGQMGAIFGMNKMK